jgi:hypothetical protein
MHDEQVMPDSLFVVRTGGREVPSGIPDSCGRSAVSSTSGRSQFLDYGLAAVESYERSPLPGYRGRGVEALV